MRGFVACAALAGAALATPGALASTTAGARIGSELAISHTAGQEQAAAIAASAFGDFIVAWQSHTATGDEVRTSVFGVNGPTAVVDDESVADSATHPAVAMDAAAAHAVILFLDAANHLAGKLLTNGPAQPLVIDSDPTATTPQPSVGMDADGHFVTVYLRGTGVDQQVIVRLFNPDGTIKQVDGQNDIVIGNASSDCTAPVVAMGARGHFVVACVVPAQGGNAQLLAAKIFAPDGALVGGSSIQLNQQTPGSGAIASPRLAVSSDGSFLATWQFDAVSLHGRWFHADRSPAGDEFAVATADVALAQGSLAVDALGNAVAVWEASNASATQSDVYARRLRPAGPVDADAHGVQVNTTHPHHRQAAPAVATDADGDFVVVWQNGVGDATTDIRGQRLVGPEDVNLALTMTAPTQVNPGADYAYTFTVSDLHAVTAESNGDSDGIKTVKRAIGGAHDVVVTTAIPSGASFVSFSEPNGADNWSCDHSMGSVTCVYEGNGGVLDPASTTTPVLLNLKAPAYSGSVPASASVSAYQFDSVQANNNASVSTTTPCPSGGGVKTASIQAPSGGEDARITLTTDVGCIDVASFKLTSEPANAPAGFDYPQGFFSYKLVNLAPGALATLVVQTPDGTGAAAWMNCIGTSCYRLPEGSGDGEVQFSGEAAVIKVRDNGAGDAAADSGVIGGTLAPARASDSGSGALSWLLLAPLAGVAVLRRRRHQA